MDEGKLELFLDRRITRSKDVAIEFVGNNLQHFNVIATEEELDKKTKLIKFAKGAVKYIGTIFGHDPDKSDYCSCDSFWYGNDDEWKKSHGYAFQCKHIIAARTIRYEGHPI